MTLLGFDALSMAWLGLLIGPVVLFYFLKLKRPRQTISSLVLWSQVINDSRVNSPFQKFKRNLLLVLQLILLVLVVLAAMQPFWRTTVSQVRRLPILIDCSASMAAVPSPGGTSRLDAAKDKVRGLIDPPGGGLSDQEFCLIAFAGTARKVIGFTNNRGLLRTALDEIRCLEVPSDIEDALRMAEAMGRTASFEQVLLISDGNFPTEVNFELSFTMNYQKLPSAGPNIGITSLNAKRTREGQWDVFVRVEGSADADTAAVLEVVRDGESIGRESLTLSAGEAPRIVFTVPGDRASTVELRLTCDGFDSLASDNRALLDLPALRSLRVYVPESLATVRHALRPLKDVRVFPDPAGRTSETSFDLLITDRREDLALDARTTMTIGLIPEALSGLVAVGDKGTGVVDWSRNSTLLQHVELANLIVLNAPVAGPEVREGDYEKLGYEVLAHGGLGPVILERREGEKLFYHLLFHTDRSTLPYRIGFPIMMSNVVQQAMHEAGLTEVRAGTTGVLAPVEILPDRTFRIESPDGETRSETSDKYGRLSGIPAPHVGLYTIFEDGEKRATVGASLLSTSETALTGVDEIQFSENLSVAAATTEARTDRSLWPLVAMLGFGMLLVEWLYYHRSSGWYKR